MVDAKSIVSFLSSNEKKKKKICYISYAPSFPSGNVTHLYTLHWGQITTPACKCTLWLRYKDLSRATKRKYHNVLQARTALHEGHRLYILLFLTWMFVFCPLQKSQISHSLALQILHTYSGSCTHFSNKKHGCMMYQLLFPFNIILDYSFPVT